MKLLLFTTSLLVLPTEVVLSESREMLLRISVATLRIVDLLPTAIPTRSVTFLSRLAAWMNKTSNKIEICHSSPFLTIIIGCFPILGKVSLKVNLHYFSILDSYNKTCLFGASCIHFKLSSFISFRGVTGEGRGGSRGFIAPFPLILAE